MEFSDISNETERTYTFFNKETGEHEQVTITNPLKLNVSASGGHRIIAQGTDELVAHYIPAGWRALTWFVKDQSKIIEF